MITLKRRIAIDYIIYIDNLSEFYNMRRQESPSETITNGLLSKMGILYQKNQLKADLILLLYQGLNQFLILPEQIKTTANNNQHDDKLNQALDKADDQHQNHRNNQPSPSGRIE